MRLRRLDLTRYGKFTDRSIDFGERTDGAPDLHIIYGPNEAGKSTAFSAFLDLLFGIELQSRYGFLHGYDTMRIGGCLELSVGARDLVRIKKPQPTLRDMAGAPVAESLIAGDLAGLDRNAYRTMFSLDDESLEAGGKSILASNGELGQLLFSASAGLSELSRTLADLRSETDGFTKPARSSELHNLKASLAALKQQRDEIDTIASEYNRLAAARDAAEAAYATALNERAEAQAALAQLGRLLTALPRAAALRSLQAELDSLANVRPAPPEWLADLPDLQRDDERHRSDATLAEANLKRLSDELAATAVDEHALALVGRLDRLTELRARHVTAELDLPIRRRELSRLGGELDATLVRLGRRREADPSALLLDAARSAALHSLIASRSGVAAKLTAATEESALALQELTEAQQALHAAASSASAPSAAPVVAALAALRASDHAIRRRAALQAEDRHREALATLLPALHPWDGTLDQLASLSPPDATTLEAWLTGAQKDDAALAQRREAVEQLETDLARRIAELETIARRPGDPGDHDAADLRGLREAAWADHRRVLDPATADTFETALRRDDLAADARAGRERETAKLQELGRALAGKQAEAIRARSLLAEVTERCAARAEALASAASGIAPARFTASPAWLLAWLARRDKALATWAERRQAERNRADADSDAAALHQRLAASLSQAEIAFDPTAGLDDLASVAQQAIDRDADAQALRRAVADCQRDLRKRELAVQKAALADKAWLAAWQAACSACWLGPQGADLPLDIVRELLATVAELGRTLEAQRDLSDRIEAMQDDQAAFVTELGRLMPAAATGPGQRPPADLAQSLVEHVQDAGRASATRRRLQDERAAAEETLRLVKAAALVHHRRVAEMTAAMDAETLQDLAARLRDAERQAGLQRQANDAERDILAALRAEDLAHAQTLLAGREAAGLELEQTRLAAHLEALEARTRELFAASKQAGDRIMAVGGDDAAARLEEQRQTKLEETKDGARRYLRLRVGIAAAEWGLRAYRDRHRSSMMTQASDAFQIISRGAYSGLRAQPDKDGDILVALPAEGGSKLATDLSKGTRFQLYLALRAAGYREFAKLRPPVPFIADDIMETFDDRRAEETLRVFEGMAGLGQVIYLTHHDHLRALAQRTVPGIRVHELGA